MAMKHDNVEKNINVMAILIVIVISIGGLVEILPLMASSAVNDPYEGIKPYPALRLEGRDFRAETERYGHYSVAGEFVYDRPFQFGSKRTGPDLARVGKRYSDDWHRIHLMNPQDLVPESNMPSYPWLATAMVDGELTQRKMRALQMLGDPYTDEEIAAAPEAVSNKTELDALVAYLQDLGTVRSAR